MKKKTLYYILSFLIPGIMMLLIYSCVGIYPFGNKTVLTVDLKDQYVAFFSALRNISSGNIGIFYSFSKTLGGNMLGLIAYYLLSPFNIFFIILNKINITEVILIVNIIKICFTGLTSYIYFNKTFKKEQESLVFSFIYSMMAYNIVYSQNIMWLDGVIWLPIIFMGVDKILEKKSPTLFYISLTICIFSNYYIGYMICIGSSLYFLYKLYLKNNYSFKKTKKQMITFAKNILLSVGTTMIVLIPALLSVFSGKIGSSASSLIPKQTYALLDLISRFYIGTFKNKDLSVGAPNIFVSLIVVALLIFYYYNKSIKKEEKQATTAFLLIFIISFIFYPIDVVWHTFQHPMGFPFRYSFIFDFILLIIAYNSYLKLESINKNKLFRVIAIIFLVSIIIDKEFYTVNIFYKIIGSFLLLTIYLLYLNRNKKYLDKGIIGLIILELFINNFIVVANIKYEERDNFKNFIDENSKIIEGIKQKDNTFYRIEKNYSYSTNDPLLLNYNGISHFSSTYEGINNKLLGDKLGIFNRFYITNYTGSTPVTNSLFNIKYLLSKKNIEYYNKLDDKLYYNKYYLPLAFMVDKRIEKLELKDLEPFENQNNILKSMTILNNNVFRENKNVHVTLENLDLEKNNGELKYTRVNSSAGASLIFDVTVEHEGLLYGYISSMKNDKVNIYLNGKSLIDISDQNSYRYNNLELGYFKVGDQISLKFDLLEDKMRINDYMFYTFNEANFQNIINELNSNKKLQITKYSSNKIEGKINVTNSRQLLYTSIPYDQSWKIKVDGKETAPIKLLDTFIGLNLENGEHTITFEYVPKGLYIGLIISILSASIFVIIKKEE